MNEIKPKKYISVVSEKEFEFRHLIEKTNKITALICSHFYLKHRENRRPLGSKFFTFLGQDDTFFYNGKNTPTCYAVNRLKQTHFQS